MGRVRTVKARAELSEQRGGPGFTSHGLRGLPGFSLDPFLSVDDFHMSVPTFPPHPHAGFSAVTYLFERSPGAFQNRDSLGDHSRIGPGAIHWTQAARGMMHEEVPQQPGIDCHGVQVFVNLRSDHKSAPPRALHADREQIPEVVQAGARVRVLAGDHGGLSSPLTGLLTPVVFLDVHLEAGAELAIPIDPAANVFVLSVAGGGAAGPTDGAAPLGPHTAVGFAADGDEIALRAGPDGLEVLVCAGRPLLEPVVLGGPFVMNRRAEIEEAFGRFERGEMGRLSRSFGGANR